MTDDERNALAEKLERMSEHMKTACDLTSVFTIAISVPKQPSKDDPPSIICAVGGTLFRDRLVMMKIISNLLNQMISDLGTEELAKQEFVSKFLGDMFKRATGEKPSSVN